MLTLDLDYLAKYQYKCHVITFYTTFDDKENSIICMNIIKFRYNINKVL